MNAELDLIRMRELLGQMSQAAHRLRQLGQETEASFLADYRNTESAKYLFVVLIEAAVDICNHIVSRRSGRSPQTYADCFAVLASLGAIEESLAERLQGMARFRNLLVHVYDVVDNRRVYRAIHDDLADADAFQRQISAWLQAEGKAGAE